MTIRTLVTSNGVSVVLQSELGRGAEGAVYSIAGDGAVVAKIYHAEPPGSAMDTSAVLSQVCDTVVLDLVVDSDAGYSIYGITLNPAAPCEVLDERTCDRLEGTWREAVSTAGGRCAELAGVIDGLLARCASY